MFVKKFQRKRIEIDIDQCFNQWGQYQISNQQTSISFFLWELIFAYGAKNTNMFAPTWRNKIFDYDYLVEKISNDRDFKVHIRRIQRDLDSEKLRKISEDFGEAFTLMLAKKLFNTKLESINKIGRNGNRRRADYIGITENGHTILFEGKGTSNNNTRRAQIRRGSTQLNQHNANIKAVVATLLQEQVSSSVEIVDPPGSEETMTERERNEIEAVSLSKLFNFLGHKELSRYFYLMYKRVNGDEQSSTLNEKEKIFQKIKTNYSEIKYRNKTYKGHFTKVKSKFVFVGVSSRLIYFQDFLESGRNEEFYCNENDKAIIYKGKILVKEFDSLSDFDEKPHVYDNIKELSISDFHYSSNEVSINILKNIFRSIGLKEEKKKVFQSLVVRHKNKKTIVIFSKFFGTDKNKIRERVKRKLSQIKDKTNYNVLLVSPNNLPNKDGKRYKILDRDKLKDCLENTDRFFDYF